MVDVDPDGPAGREYALPLDRARGEAAGDSGLGSPAATESAPLFGEGVTPSAGKADDDPDKAKGGDEGATEAAAPSSDGGDDGGSSAPWLIVGLVMLVGAGLGVLLRRQASPSHS